jgi:hypothetical protein
VSAAPRILIIVRECSEVIGVSANDEKGTGSFWELYPAAEHDSIKSVRNANAQFTSLADLLLSVRPTGAAGAEGGRHARAAWSQGPKASIREYRTLGPAPAFGFEPLLIAVETKPDKPLIKLSVHNSVYISCRRERSPKIRQSRRFTTTAAGSERSPGVRFFVLAAN